MNVNWDDYFQYMGKYKMFQTTNQYVSSSMILLNFLNQTPTTPVVVYAILPRACFALDGQTGRRLRLRSSVQRSHFIFLC